MRRWYVGAIVACLTVFAKLRMIVLSIALAAAQLQHHVHQESSQKCFSLFCTVLPVLTRGMGPFVSVMHCHNQNKENNLKLDGGQGNYIETKLTG